MVRPVRGGRRRSALSRRSPAEWAVRVVLALLALWLGWISVTHSLAQSLRTRAPERAYALAPWDARVAATYSATLAGPEATPEDRARADEIARDALRRDPTAVAAVATLGINAAIREDAAEARRLFAYSEMLSRRDLRTRLWAIEDAVAREDVPGVLRNYDIALRTSRVAPDLLFPVLSTAISDPAVRVELVRMMAARPAWGGPFVEHAAATGPDPVAVAHLFPELARVGVAIPETARNLVINRLIDDNRGAEAWAFYAAVGGAQQRDRSRDPDFEGNQTYPSAFDWRPIEEGGVVASIQRGERGGLFDFGAPPSVGGALLQQRQLLPAGDYVIEGRSAGIEQVPVARPFWLLACSDGRELGRVVLPNSAEAGGRFSGRVTVPADCPAQTLSLVARPSSEIGGLSGQIEQVQLRPAGSAS